jgi:hypothetical protein
VIGRAVVEMLRDSSIDNGAYLHAQPYLRQRLGDEKYRDVVNGGTGS